MKHSPDRTFDISALRRVGPWSRWLIAALAGALLWLFVTASQHHHASDVEDADCAICTAVVHHVVDLTASPNIAPPVVAVAYLIEPASGYVTTSFFKAVCPPICGPPSLV
jgi:hypothetical protein